MIVIPPSLQNRFTWVWSRDPALASPSAGSDEATRAEWEQRLEIARETGKWTDLLREGEHPTTFTVKPLSGALLRRLTDDVVGNRIGQQVLWAVVARLCLRGVANPDIKVDTEAGTYGEWAKADVTDKLDEISPGIVTELGSYLFARASSPPGK